MHPPPPPQVGLPVPVPPKMNQPLPGRTTWSSGLCGCVDDPWNCLATCLCPCVTFGQIANIVDQGSCPCDCLLSGTLYAILCCTCLCCVCSCFYRSKLRRQYDLDEGPIPDCLVHLCCEYCALCQEYRELRSRGFDMSLGWQANMEKKRRRAATSTPLPAMAAPAMQGGMMR